MKIKRENIYGQSNKEYHCITRRILTVLSGNSFAGLLSNVLSDKEQLSLSKIKPLVKDINNCIADDISKKSKWKPLQWIAPHMPYVSMKKFTRQICKY